MGRGMGAVTMAGDSPAGGWSAGRPLRPWLACDQRSLQAPIKAGIVCARSKQSSKCSVFCAWCGSAVCLLPTARWPGTKDRLSCDPSLPSACRVGDPGAGSPRDYWGGLGTSGERDELPTGPARGAAREGSREIMG